MKEQHDTVKLSVYIPLEKQEEKLIERLMAIGKKRDRTVNYLVVEAIKAFVEREEDA